MKRSIRLSRLLVVALVAAAATVSGAQLAHAGPEEPDMPADIAVPDGHKLFLIGHAVGVQIHKCNATASGFLWSFVGPRADLFDRNGKLLATHFGGPTWQARDGSYVVGKAEKRVTPDASAIPWLLLSAPTTAAGPDGDRLTGTKFIQRIATTGGLEPPAAECNATTAGTTKEVPYTADYTFWKATGA